MTGVSKAPQRRGLTREVIIGCLPPLCRRKPRDKMAEQSSKDVSDQVSLWLQ